MKLKLLAYLIVAAPVFYQLDYRQRVEAELSIPGLAGFAVKKSFETRYRIDEDAKAANEQTRESTVSE
jgi:hypothetical protein